MGNVRRVLVVDDSPTTRTMLAAVIEDHPALTVVAQARNGREAIQLVEQRRPDIVTMDVRMPGMDGIEATEHIMSACPTPIVIVAGAARDAEVRASLEAMELGALAVLPKPRGPLAPEFQTDCAALQRTLVALADVRVVTRRRKRESRRTRTSDKPKARTPCGAVALAASTGGPCALRQILSELPGTLPVPVLVVQHIAPGFVEGLAEWLDEATPLRVSLAAERTRLRGGHVYVAPDEHHLGVERGCARLDPSPPIGRFRPSADYLFESAAHAYGGELFAGILTGMGEDGVAGLEAVRAAGGDAVAQDEASSVVYGMPREAARRRLVRASLGPSEIAREIRLAVA
ncbi:MAG: chemotaxis-specific protein-glutamate methyltransferase CheB [Planctomycetota bacterium]|nr:chemotaxis-specific protein-glutamate methyltransferase CheB [Planctomycetota bacterium]